MSLSDRERWDAKYATKVVSKQLAPDDWLIEQVRDLPPGRALELCCGLGHNSIWLATQGWEVDAVDVSPVALERAAELAARHGASVRWIAADLGEFMPASTEYDLVVVFRFLERTQILALVERALRPGGRPIYETFTLEHITRPDSHLRNPAYALAPGDLPRLFPQLTTLSYRECALPDRDVARLVAQR